MQTIGLRALGNIQNRGYYGRRYFLIQKEGKLLEMKEKEYDSESLLQEVT